MILQDVCAKLEEHSPLRYMAEWDNSGLQVGGRQQEIRSILITLDVTDEAIDYAIDARADLILSHHPLIFSALKSVTEEDLCGRRILKLIRHHICCYAMHTNFDVMGMADAAADALGLKKCEVLEVTYEDEVSKEGFGRVGELSSPMRAGEYAGHVKKSFSLDHVVFYGDRDALIERVAICPGSGRSMAPAVLLSGADLYVTGDMGHHDALDLTEQGLCVVDAGHYGVEKLFVPYMEEFLHRECGEMKVITYPGKAPGEIL